MSWKDFFKPSNWLKSLLLRLSDKLTSRLYEGPEPPKRLRERVKLFKLYNPDATAEQWERFSLTLATNCYREGFVRGYEWQERDWKGPAVEPERLQELQDQDWSLAESHEGWGDVLRRGYDPRSPLAKLSPEQRRAFVETLQGSSRYPLYMNFDHYDGIPGFHEDSEDG